MKKHEFKENDFVIFDSISQRVEYCLIAKANMYPIDNFCVDKEQKACEIRFRPYAKGFTTWYMGPENTETKITPQEFLKLISQYEVGDEVEVLRSGADGCFAHQGEIHPITELFLTNESPHVRISTTTCGYINIKYIKLHKSISDKQSKTTDMESYVKVGDLVRIIGNTCDHGFTIGQIVEVHSIDRKAYGGSIKNNSISQGWVAHRDYEIINNQKTTGMKKFKNSFKVLGNLSLRKALIEELEVLGYYDNHGIKATEDSFANQLVVRDGTLGNYAASSVTPIYTLPQDWDTALAAAKETVEEQKTYQFGGRTMYRYEDHLTSERNGSGDAIGIDALKKWYKWYCIMPNLASGHSLSIPDGHLKVGCTTGTLHEALVICKDLFD